MSFDKCVQSDDHHIIKLQTVLQYQMFPFGSLQAICSYQPQPQGTADLFSVPIVLPFLEGLL